MYLLIYLVEVPFLDLLISLLVEHFPYLDVVNIGYRHQVLVFRARSLAGTQASAAISRTGVMLELSVPIRVLQDGLVAQTRQNILYLPHLIEIGPRPQARLPLDPVFELQVPFLLLLETFPMVDLEPLFQLLVVDGRRSVRLCPHLVHATLVSAFFMLDVN